LVTIPVSLYPATKREELKFRLLRKSDHSPVNYKRVAEADGKEVPWDQIVAATKTRATRRKKAA
jgi:DNA end-binding protein Ku